MTETVDVTPTPTRSEARATSRARAKVLFTELKNAPEGSSAARDARDELVRMHMPLVEYLAKRFQNRGEPLEDLVQVAMIGLIKAVDRFDSEREIEFSTFATPTIVGEVKRHFRDKGWMIRVPRRLQELKLSIGRAVTALNQDLGRSPTVAELAEKLNISAEEVVEGLEASRAYSAMSLDASSDENEDGSSASIADSLGFIDPMLGQVELRESLRPLLESLSVRERQIVMLRFFDAKTQSQIATELNISQMHVSRLLNKALASLKEGLSEVR